MILRMKISLEKSAKNKFHPILFKVKSKFNWITQPKEYMKKHGILLQKRVKSNMLLFIIQTKVNARLHMPGEEISIVYNMEDQDSV